MVDVQAWGAADTARLMRVPGADDDKHSRGVVALRTGSDRYPGAAVLGVEAVWRAGAGYVRFVGGRRACDAVLARRPETVTGPDIGGTRPDAWVIGSGTDPADRTADEERALRAVLDGAVPVVVDAGSLDLAPGAAAPILVTPHAGEFARLRERLQLTAAASDDRTALVVQTARALGRTVLLKGAVTLIATSAGRVVAVDAAPGWLATAGAGDVLGGVLGAVIAANPDAPLADAAAAAVWLHGRAAALAAGVRAGQPGHPIVALDVAEALPLAVAELLS